jgi:hypothetical protein
MRRLGGLKKGGGMNEPVSGGLGGMELFSSVRVLGVERNVHLLSLTSWRRFRNNLIVPAIE